MTMMIRIIDNPFDRAKVPEVDIPKGRMNSVIANNIEKMAGEDNDMWMLLGGESMGGNARTYEGVPCYAANFHYDLKTGKIIKFTNSPLKDKNLGEGYFRLRIDTNEIVSNKYDVGDPEPDALINVENTVELYNKIIKEAQ